MLEVPRIASTDAKAPTGYYIKEREGTSSNILCPFVIDISSLDTLVFVFLNLDPTFFPGRAATIYYRAPPKSAASHNIHTVKREIKSVFNASDDKEIGLLGILHPTVLEKFEIGYPCSALEFSLESFIPPMHPLWESH